MKTYLALVLIFCSLVMTILAKDAVYRDFFASLGIVIGGLTSASFSEDSRVEN